MNDDYKILKSLVTDLDTASELVNGAAQKSHLLGKKPESPNFVRCVGEALSYIHDLQSQLYNIDPDLTPLFLRPSLAPVNLNSAIARLSSQNQAIRTSTIYSFKGHMSDSDSLGFTEACDLGLEIEFAQKWWDRQRKPYIPVIYVYKFLRHEDKHMRFHSARAIEDIFEVTLWSEEKDDVILEAADKWFNSWQRSNIRSIS